MAARDSETNKKIDKPETPVTGGKPGKGELTDHQLKDVTGGVDVSPIIPPTTNDTN